MQRIFEITLNKAEWKTVGLLCMIWV